MDNQKPPIGLIPEWAAKRERLKAIDECLVRYINAGYPIAQEWIIERTEILSYLNKRNNGS